MFCRIALNDARETTETSDRQTASQEFTTEQRDTERPELEFIEAVEDVADEDLLGLVQTTDHEQLPVGHERRQQFETLQGMAEPTREVSQIRHAIWYEWNQRLAERASVLLDLIPTEHHASIIGYISAIAEELQPLSFILDG